MTTRAGRKPAPEVEEAPYEPFARRQRNRTTRRFQVSPGLAGDVGTGSLSSLDRSYDHLQTKLRCRLWTEQAEKALGLPGGRGQSMPHLLQEGSSAGNSPRIDTDKALLRGFAARTDSMNASVGRSLNHLDRHAQAAHDRSQSHWRQLRGAVRLGAILHRSHAAATGVPSSAPLGEAEFLADMDNFEQILEDSQRSVRMHKYEEALRANSAEAQEALKKAQTQKLRRQRTTQKLETVGTDPRSRAQARIDFQRERDEDDELHGREKSFVANIPMEPFRVQREGGVERLKLVNVQQLQSQCLGLNAMGNSRYDSVIMVAREKEKRQRWEREALGSKTTDHVRMNRQPGSSSMLSRTQTSMAVGAAGHKRFLDVRQAEAQRRRREASDLKYARQLLNLRGPVDLSVNEGKAEELDDIMAEIQAAAEEMREQQQIAAAHQAARMAAEAEQARMRALEKAASPNEDEDEEDDDE